MNIPRQIFLEYRKWKGNWDALCSRCGQCCYTRHLSPAGEVVVDRDAPCTFLDETSHLCSVFENRFSVCSRCGRVGLLRALFHPLLPPGCAYAQTFRVWRRNNPGV